MIANTGFTESMDTNALIVWLRSKGIPNSDVAILQGKEINSKLAITIFIIIMDIFRAASIWRLFYEPQ